MSSVQRGDMSRDFGDVNRPRPRIKVHRLMRVDLQSAVNVKKAKKQNSRCCSCRHLHTNTRRMTSPRRREGDISRAYYITNLITLLGVKYQGKAESPFETHPAVMWAFFTAICICYLAPGFTKEMQTQLAWCSRILRNVIPISGSFASLLLVSVFPDQGWFVLPIVVVWVLLHIILKLEFFKHICYCLCKIIGKAITQMFDNCNKFAGRNQTQEPTLPTQNSSSPR